MPPGPVAEDRAQSAVGRVTVMATARKNGNASPPVSADGRL